MDNHKDTGYGINHSTRCGGSRYRLRGRYQLDTFPVPTGLWWKGHTTEAREALNVPFRETPRPSPAGGIDALDDLGGKAAQALGWLGRPIPKDKVLDERQVVVVSDHVEQGRDVGPLQRVLGA